MDNFSLVTTITQGDEGQDMLQFLVKRLIGLVFVILGVTFITFIMGYFGPSDPIRISMGTHFDPHTWMRLRHQYGLDLPWYQQYYNFITRFAHGDLGVSYKPLGRHVADIIHDALPYSLELALWGTLITVLLGIPTGILSAVKANSWIDTSNMAVALIFYALPPFIIAVFAQFLVSWLNSHLGTSWPISTWGTPWSYAPGDLQFKIVPILVYGAAGYAYFARLTRTTMLEVLRQDYVRTARAKGLLERAVIYRHALRNALIPLITVIGLFIGLLVAGAFFVEYVFTIPGVGQTSVNAISNYDYPTIQATVVLVAIGVVVGNLISDILYTVVDPRIKLA